MLHDTPDNSQKTVTPPAQNSEASGPGRHPNSLANLERHKFQPGQSGNPGGRPKKVLEIADKALDMADEMLEELKTIAKDKEAPPAVRLQAIKEINDRGLGRPMQSIDVAQETSHTLSEEFEFIVRKLNDRKDPETKALIDSTQAELIDFSVLDRFEQK